MNPPLCHQLQVWHSGWMPLSPLRLRSRVQLVVIPTIAQLVPMKCHGAWGEDYTCAPSFFAKENKIDLDFNEVVRSNHVTVAYDILPTLKQGANTNQAHQLISNDDARIGPINGKFLKCFYA